MKKVILTILVIIWMSVIFMFSNQNGNQSKSLSDKVVIKVENVITGKKNKKINNNLSYIVRKTGHITEYFILGLLVYLTLKSYNISNKTIVISIIICILYAISDEIHQIFTFERSAQIKDVIIDTSGSILGILLINRIEGKLNGKTN